MTRAEILDKKSDELYEIAMEYYDNAIKNPSEYEMSMKVFSVAVKEWCKVMNELLEVL